MGRNGMTVFDDENGGLPLWHDKWAGAFKPHCQPFGAFYYEQPPQSQGGGWGGSSGSSGSSGSGNPWPQGGELVPPPYAPPYPPAASDAPTEVWGAPPPYPPNVPPTYQGYGAPPSQGYPPAYPYNPYGAPPPPPPRKSRVGLIVGIVVSVVVVACLGSIVGLYALGKSGLANEAQATQTAEAAGPGTNSPGTNPSATVLYQDQLNTSTTGWADDNNCSMRADGLHVSNSYICYAPTDTLGNIDVTVQVKQTSGSAADPYGIVVRRASKGNYYQFIIDGNSEAAIAKCVSTETDCTTLADFATNAAIQGGKNVTNTLEVKAVNSHFEFDVNGQKVDEVDDSTFASGLVGLGAIDSVTAVYSNLKITQAS